MDTSKPVKRVREALNAIDPKLSVLEMPTKTQSSQDAANTLQCELGQIAKSLVFSGKISRRPYLVVASGVNRVDTEKLSDTVGEQVKLAKPSYVEEHTGFIIGGVSPIGLIEDMPIYIDEDLMKYDTIWAAAGSSYAVFEVSPELLVAITGGIMLRVN